MFHLIKIDDFGEIWNMVYIIVQASADSCRAGPLLIRIRRSHRLLESTDFRYTACCRGEDVLYQALVLKRDWTLFLKDWAGRHLSGWSAIHASWEPCLHPCIHIQHRVMTSICHLTTRRPEWADAESPPASQSNQNGRGSVRVHLDEMGVNFKEGMQWDTQG